MRKLPVLGAAGLCLVIGACREEGTPARTEAPIIGGALDDAHPAVVALWLPEVGRICSGVLIAPDLVITAAHCVFGFGPGDVIILVGQSVFTPDAVLGASDIFVQPGVTGELLGVDAPGGVDLAIVRLSTPAEIEPAIMDLQPTGLLGSTVEVVGYGIDDPAGTGAGLRRTVATSVAAVCPRLIFLPEMERNSCLGDSGGGLFLGGNLIALTTLVGSGGCGSTWNTRLDVHAAWIQDVLAGQPPTGLADCPACLTPETPDLEAECGGTVPDGGIDIEVVDAGPLLPDGAPGLPDAAPEEPDAGPELPDAALPSPDAAVGADDDGGGGCGCRTAGHSGTVNWTPLIALAILVGLRRRTKMGTSRAS